MGIISYVKKLFKGPAGEIMRMSSGNIGVYKLDDSRVDYELARELYQNKNANYKLGSSFVRPIVNSTTGFMGVPHFQIEDEEAQYILDEFVLGNTSKMLKTHTDSLKQGDCYIWITREERENPLYPDKKVRLIYNFISPEEVKEIILDPTTKEPIAYILESQNEWTDLGENKRRAKVKQIITAESRFVEVEGDKIEGLEEGETPNVWGFIPIIHFKNEADETLKYGQSDIEPIEPLLKAYHDVMLHALKGSKMHSTPKLKLKLTDVASFLAHNFGVEDPVKFAKEGGKINLDGHEILFLNKDEEAEFVEVKSAIGDAKELLKLLFYCIVDVSETPEFIFGVHTPSALASVKEQMPIMVNKIRRKREQFTNSWQLLARMVLIMSSNSSGMKYSTYDVNIGWDEVNPRDDKELAETLEKVCSALDKALEGGFISEESTVNFLAQYIDTMSNYISDDPEIVGEREKIIKTKMLKYRLDDSQGLDDESNEIDKEIDKIKDNNDNG
ncbi:TPA: phage portal protein [Clostridioides difficile]|nr:phage portal protein [Clostridioides difficile]